MRSVGDISTPEPCNLISVYNRGVSFHTSQHKTLNLSVVFKPSHEAQYTFVE